jgi:polyisoprenoid-binding protein YceI
MKKYLITVFLLPLLFSLALAQHYKPVEEKSAVQFKVSHQMIFKSTVTGSFSGLKGTILFDPKELSASSFDVSIDAATINTGVGMRDNDLKKDKYFDVQQYPVITIRSKAITKGAHENEYLLSAFLTMKGKTLPISFPFTAVQKNSGYILKGQFHINRLEFNIGPENSIDKDVAVDLTIEAL